VASEETTKPTPRKRAAAKKTAAPKKGQVTGLERDKLTRSQLRALYGITAAQLRIDDELFDVFKEAWEGGWEGETGRARFWAKIQETNWWQSNSKSVRDYLFLSATPDNADFLQLKEESYEAVRRRAMKIGKNLSEDQLRQIAEQNLMFGWSKDGRDLFLDRAIVDAPSEGSYGGDIRLTADNLRAVAMANGVKYDDAWYDGAAKSIASQLTQGDYWENQIREQAAGLFPVFGEQIRMGLNMRDIASPYIRMMADTWEINPAEIMLDDNTLIGALTSYDQSGKPMAMNLGEFKRQLRKDPRWMETSQAQNEVASVGSRVLRMFGLG
jgi:hypothetical protein